MAFRVRWTDQRGAVWEPSLTAKAALHRYIEMLGKGYAGVEVYDDSGKKLTSDELTQLMLIETGKL